MLLSEKISIHVTPEDTQAFRELSRADLKKLEFLRNFDLLDATRAHDSLNVIMREISKNTEHREMALGFWKDRLEK